MLKTYLKIAFRSLMKNRLVSTINVLGLAVGIATCTIIGLYVLDESSYDRFWTYSDRIYRVTLDAKIGEDLLHEASVMAPVAQTIQDELPEIEASTRVIKVREETKIRMGENVLRKGTTAFVDSNFFGVFDLPFVSGDPKTALDRPNTLVITETQANALFDDKNPINQVIQLEDIGYYTSEFYDLAGDYTITGVIRDMPRNAHFHFDMLASMHGNADAKNQSWLSGSYVTYLLLNKDADPFQVESKLPAFTKKHLETQMKQGLGLSYEEFFERGNYVFLKLQAITDIHLNPLYTGKGDFEPGGDRQTVLIYCAIAVFMLLIACINFMNLSTAGASQRVKEIGVRKVMGSDKRHLIFQFLAESLVAVCIAMILGGVMAKVALPFFNNFAEKSLVMRSLLEPAVVLALGAMLLLVTILAGGYPAFFLSSFKPIESLKKKIATSGRVGFRSTLVVFQFAISVVLTIGALVVSQQMSYIQNRDLGYDRNQLIVLRNAGLLGEHLDVFRDKLRADPRVKSVTKSAYIPSGPTDTSNQSLSSKDDPTTGFRMVHYGIDEEYISTMGMEIVAGRNFSQDFGSERYNIIINQTAARELGIAEDPIGKVFEQLTDNEEEGKK